jgi:hypothetical protein
MSASPNTRYRRWIVAAVATVAAAGTVYATAGDATPHHSQPSTPNQCILLNHGDFNACNVGNSGRGDLPYKPVGTNGGV